MIERGGELRGRDRPGVDTEAGFVRIELDAAESSRVVDAQVAPVVEPNGEPVPRRLTPGARVLQIVHPGSVVEHEPPRHPEAEAEHGAVVHVEEQQLPDAPGAHEPAADKRVGDDVSREAALQEPRVRRVDAVDQAPEGAFRQPAVVLDLDELRHRR